MAGNWEESVVYNEEQSRILKGTKVYVYVYVYVYIVSLSLYLSISIFKS